MFSVDCCREKVFSRKLDDLRAARLFEQAVVTGGYDGNNARDEVLFEMILVVIFLGRDNERNVKDEVLFETHGHIFVLGLAIRTRRGQLD